MKEFNIDFLQVSVDQGLPPFLYGTAWKGDQTQRCVEDAIAAGFRGIDTANQLKHYFEAGVGAALTRIYSRGDLSRKDFFIQSKFTSLNGQDHRLPYQADAPLHRQVEQSLGSSLDHLQTDYLDSYLLHGPMTSRGLIEEDWEIWNAMEELYRKGKTKRLGVSNVNLEQLITLWEGSEIKPQFVQNRCFARMGWDQEIRSYCLQQKIVYQGFSLLTANLGIFQDPRLIEIYNRLKCTSAQTVFRFALQVGMLPLTGTTDPKHMAEDLESLKLKLSPEDLRTIERISIR